MPVYVVWLELRIEAPAVHYSVDYYRFDPTGINRLPLPCDLPIGFLRVDIVNQGNAIAREIVVEIQSKRSFSFSSTNAASSLSSKIEHSPRQDSGFHVFQIETLVLDDLVTVAGISCDDSGGLPTVIAYASDKPAKKVNDAKSVKPFSQWTVAEPAVFIFIVLLTLAVISWILVRLKESPTLRKALADEFL